MSTPRTAVENTIKSRLTAFDTLLPDDAMLAGTKSAAVALVIVDAGLGADLPGMSVNTTWSSDPALVLTIRSSKLTSHAGQWALPGGRIDKDETPQRAAIRETHEEIGLELSEDDCLGQLDDYATRSGYVITPFVFCCTAERKLCANLDEVASIHRIPFSELLREDAPILNKEELSDGLLKNDTGARQPVLRMPIGNDWIAAPTAAILYQFREVCLLNKQTRVAHFEQPVFAWR